MRVRIREAACAREIVGASGEREVCGGMREPGPFQHAGRYLPLDTRPSAGRLLEGCFEVQPEVRPKLMVNINLYEVFQLEAEPEEKRNPMQQASSVVFVLRADLGGGPGALPCTQTACPPPLCCLWAATSLPPPRHPHTLNNPLSCGCAAAHPT